MRTKTRARLTMEWLEERQLLAANLLQVDYFPTWKGGVIPSTDPAGITWHPSGSLYLADSEINEMSQYFTGHNIFEITPAGDRLIRKIASKNSEPTGIAYSEYGGNSYFYITNDDAHTITRYDTNFRVLKTVKTNVEPANLKDPEDIAANLLTGDLYVAGGTARKVVIYDANLNYKSSFSVSSGAGAIRDPEGIAYHPVTGNLFLVSTPDEAVFEYTVGGTFVARYSIGGFSPSPKAPQGATFAPTSNPNDDPDNLALYIVDGGQDNYPDGGVYEAVLSGGTSSNTAPTVNAGPDRAITGSVPTSVFLDGSASDDGLPTTGSLSVAWSQVSGPATVGFTDPTFEDTLANFPASGVYVLRLTANDGQLSSSDDVMVTVNADATNMLETRIKASSDDAEEKSSKSVVLTSGALDMGVNTVGIRFTGVAVPQGATITKAYVQFEAKETHAEGSTLSIYGEATGNSSAFAALNGDISSRTKTAQSVAWSPPAWTQGEAAAAERTPDLAAILDEIVARADWSSGNALSLIITGTGARLAKSYDSRPDKAPLLHVEFALAAPPVSGTLARPTDSEAALIFASLEPALKADKAQSLSDGLAASAVDPFFQWLGA